MANFMKHIKRKTVTPASLPKEKVADIFPGKLPEDALKNIKYSQVKGMHGMLIMESGELIHSFFYNNNGKACTIPLANPVLIYFNLAQSYLKDISNTKETLLSLFKADSNINEDSLSLFYRYFGLTSSFVVMLMTSLEAFVNQKIDKDYEYKKQDQNKCLKVYNYEQIQRWIPLTEKIGNILNPVTSKNFGKNYKLKQTHIDNLKTLRDLIVHTKAGNNYEEYIELYKKSLNFNFNESIEAVQDFINFYEPNLIEACGCGADI